MTPILYMDGFDHYGSAAALAESWERLPKMPEPPIAPDHMKDNGRYFVEVRDGKMVMIVKMGTDGVPLHCEIKHVPGLLSLGPVVTNEVPDDQPPRAA